MSRILLGENESILLTQSVEKRVKTLSPNYFVVLISQRKVIRQTTADQSKQDTPILDLKTTFNKLSLKNSVAKDLKHSNVRGGLLNSKKGIFCCFTEMTCFRESCWTLAKKTGRFL